MSRISRRDFLMMVGAGGAGAGAGFMVVASAKRPAEQYVPYVVTPEDYSPGIATWYNTVCGMCGAGCGISVRIREGRAKKIEGNPLHPVSQGRVCAMGQAGLNVLYNPDRIRQPLKRVGARGSGEFEEIGWDEALALAAQHLSGAGAGNAYLLAGAARGHLAPLFARFMDSLGSPNVLHYDPTTPHALYEANRLAFGASRLPYYDIRNASFVLSFGADFLGAWISPVHHSLGYGHLRQGEDRERGTLVQVEQRMSTTGANADRWLPASAGSEGLLALAICHEMVNGGRYAGSDRAVWRSALSDYEPSAVADRVGLPADTITGLAAQFAAADRPLALGGGAASGGTNGVATLLAINALNFLAQNLGKPGGILFNPPAAFGRDGPGASMSDMREFLEDAVSGAVDVLLVNEADPVFSLPGSAGAAQALDKVGAIISIGSFVDDTTAMADLVLPTHTFLETWWDDAPEPGVGMPVASLAQPVIQPIYETRAPADIVLDLARAMGGKTAAAMPWEDGKAYLREQWNSLYEARREQLDEPDFEAFWQAVLQAGVWGEQIAPVRPTLRRDDLLAGIGDVSPAFEGSDTEYPFVLQPFRTLTFNDGRAANLPWMQELPDPLTSIVWGSWVEINPLTAAGLGIGHGDILELTSTAGTVTVPAYLYEGIRPDVLAMPLGQGHGQYGRYASGRGANPMDVLAPVTDARSGALASAATRVQIRNTGASSDLLHTRGVNRTLGRQILGPAHDGHG